MITSQMLKGFLEGCILQIISLHETYGYEISQKLNTFGFGEISEGTIYPLLLRLQKNNLIAATLKASSNGPNRKYFHLTTQGEEALQEFKAAYQELFQAMSHLFPTES